MEALAGMTEAQAAELRELIRAQQADASIRQVDPEALNHAFLTFMQQAAAVLNLRPCEVEDLTTVKRQHQRKLKPDPLGQGEAHVTLVTLARWTGGMRLCLLRVLEWLLARAFPVLMATEPIAA